MKRGGEARPFDILLVEDNPGDVDLITEALGTLQLVTRISVASDGVDALALLRGDDPTRPPPRPDLLFLDLNLPRKDGREVLAEMKSDPDLRQIPVVVLPSSDAERDLQQAYGLHANCLVTKPVDLEAFLSCVGETARFWLSVARIPNPREA